MSIINRDNSIDTEEPSYLLNFNYHLDRIGEWDIFGVFTHVIYSPSILNFHKVAISDRGDAIWLDRSACSSVSEEFKCITLPINIENCSNSQNTIINIITYSVNAKLPSAIHLKHHTCDISGNYIYGNVVLYVDDIGNTLEKEWSYKFLIHETSAGLIRRVR